MPEVSRIPHIIYSCLARKSRGGEQFVPMYVLTQLVAGTSRVLVDGITEEFNAGDIRFIRRNTLAGFDKQPPPDGDYVAISVAIDQDTLRALADELQLRSEQPYGGPALIRLPQHVLLQSFFESLHPYMDDPVGLSPMLTQLKVREAVMILLELRPALRDLLFDFSEPGKIDLEAFMNANYRFNVSLERFAYLTGRSLASFKRDFERHYGEPPGRWLIRKRLEDAHYQLSTRHRPVGDVCVDVGFKDLSHFSQAFKRAYGIAPSQLLRAGTGRS